MRLLKLVTVCALVATVQLLARPIDHAQSATAGPFTLVSARVSLEGTSNLHEYSASTTSVRVNAVELNGTTEGDLLEQLLQPGNLKTFDVTIPVTSLKSPKDGIDGNMHKALKGQQNPDIRFRLKALEVAGTDYRAAGWLSIAGVEKEVTLTLKATRKDDSVAISGGTDLLMIDYGITPPKAMLGMLRTNPKVHIQIDLTLGVGE
jgi:polyisoprenoid-binding protein YceI